MDGWNRLLRSSYTARGDEPPMPAQPKTQKLHDATTSTETVIGLADWLVQGRAFRRLINRGAGRRKNSWLVDDHHALERGLYFESSIVVVRRSRRQDQTARKSSIPLFLRVTNR
mmetsp:Transcript_23314/g.34558  ORF Transcript_23314/g.34558 Transcript_23314/m.34558 type:complete len:114 (-) Transcript_23314:123-464(-)